MTKKKVMTINLDILNIEVSNIMPKFKPYIPLVIINVNGLHSPNTRAIF